MEENDEKYEKAHEKWESECPCNNPDDSLCTSTIHCRNGGPCKDYDSWLLSEPKSFSEIDAISRRNFSRLDLDRLSKELSLGKIITILKLIDSKLVRGESWFMEG